MFRFKFFLPVLSLVVFLIPSTSEATLLATFDSYSEGYFADSIVDGGITFSDVQRWQSDHYTNFAIEQCNASDMGSELSMPNALGFGGYVPGTGEAFGSIGEFFFSSGTAARSAALDVWTLPLIYSGNTLTLEGYLGSTLVDSVSITQNQFGIGHWRMALPTDDYDHFRLVSSGPQVSGDSFVLVDNVSVEAVPEPGTMTAAAAGSCLLLLKRKRR